MAVTAGAVDGMSVLTTSPSLKIKALNNMGFAYRDMGHSDQARQSFEAAKKLQGP